MGYPFAAGGLNTNIKLLSNMKTQKWNKMGRILATGKMMMLIAVGICATQLSVKANDVFSEGDIDNGSIPYQGSSVIAYGYGDSYWQLSTARIEALDHLNEEKARIEASLRPGLSVNWGQIHETQMSDWTGHYVYLSQDGEVQGTGGAAAQAELTLMMMAAENAMATAEEDLSGIGMGWSGNVTHLGPQCNVVHDYMAEEIQAILDTYNVNGDYYVFVTLFEEGALPWDLAAHVYYGIMNVQTGEVVYIFDPWRTGNVDPICPCDNPNGDPEQVIEW